MHAYVSMACILIYDNTQYNNYFNLTCYSVEDYLSDHCILSLDQVEYRVQSSQQPNYFT